MFNTFIISWARGKETGIVKYEVSRNFLWECDNKVESWWINRSLPSGNMSSASNNDRNMVIFKIPLIMGLWSNTNSHSTTLISKYLFRIVFFNKNNSIIISQAYIYLFEENFCIKKINSFIYKPVKVSFLFLYLLLHIGQNQYITTQQSWWCQKMLLGQRCEDIKLYIEFR